MSAKPVADACPHCGADAPVRARFCPECGTRLEEPGRRTVRVQLPPEETGAVPVSMHAAEPRWFGVAPPQLLLALTALLLVVALALFATGHWPYGLIVLGIGAFLLAAFVEAARGRRDEPRAGSDVRERARSRWEELRARASVSTEARRLQSALLLLESDRRQALGELGAAAHVGDSSAEAAARARLAELDGREADLNAQLERALTDAGERIRQARLPVEETMMVLPSEPAPPPGEATPPQPAVVPEPYPPPDEGTPPEPARIPEPSPDQPRED